MVKVCEVPVQPTTGSFEVTIIVAVIGEVVLLVAVNAGIFPVPLAASPIKVFEFVHVYCVPLTVLLKSISGCVLLLHTV